MKKTIKILIFSMIMLFIVAITEVNAASASISASKTSATVGDSVTITVKINAAAWNVKVNGSGISDTIAGYNEDAVNETKTKTYTLNTSTAGTYTVSISGDVTDENDSKEYPSQSVTVTVSNPAPKPEPEPEKPTTPSTNNKPTNNNTQTVTKSSNSKLEKLEIAEGTITPEFSSSVKEYSISVPNEVTKLSISATADSSKATVRITGNEELVVGENEIEVIVTAEDGSKTTYTILATRKQAELSLKELSVYYIDDNSEKVLLKLDPQFSFDVYEYKITDKLPHHVKELIIEANANRENATIQILGNEELKTGENTITVKTTITDEAGLEEKKTYTVKVQKEEEPVVVALSPLQKIKNWFSGIGAGITGWATRNFNNIITGMLLASTLAFVGLTGYFVYDYKNYKKVLAKLAELNKSNLMERVNIALDTEIANKNIAEIENPEKIEIEEYEEVQEEPIVVKTKKSKGKRFK